MLSIIHVEATNPANTINIEINNAVEYSAGIWICFKHNVGILLAIIMPLNTKNMLTNTGFLNASISPFVANQKINGKITR